MDIFVSLQELAISKTFYASILDADDIEAIVALGDEDVLEQPQHEADSDGDDEVEFDEVEAQ